MPVTSGENEPALSFDRVSFSYGLTTAVDDVTFSVERGEFVAMVGPNGGGKSTLVKLAVALEQPKKGWVKIFGQDSRRFESWWRIGYVPQTASAFSVRFPASVAEVVSYGEYGGFNPLAFFHRGISPGVREALETVGLWDHRRRQVSELSVGQKQLVLIARALVHRPDLLILDEPTAGLDVTHQERFYHLLQEMRREMGVTILLVSHDVGVVLHEATRIACINQALVFHGRPEEVTDEALSQVYGFPVDLVIHRHD
jgi:zinc transport system ATP-binding protein